MTTKMRPFGKTISPDEARKRIDAAVRPIDRTERVALAEASGRVLAEDVVANADVPPFARAAMDGYAVRAQDTAGASGARAGPQARRDSVYRPGDAADRGRRRVHRDRHRRAHAARRRRRRDCRRHRRRGVGGRPRIRGGPTGQHIGRQGADIRSGQRVLHAGTTLTPSRVGAIAALGLDHAAVYARPRIAILSTGNEIVDPGGPLAPGQIYDVNRFTLAAVAAEHGAEPVTYRTANDTFEDLPRARRGAPGRRPRLLGRKFCWRARPDPGCSRRARRGDLPRHRREAWQADRVRPASGKLFFGMPGYPASCLTNAYILLAPVLRRMARLAPQVVRSVNLLLSAPITSAPGRHQFYTVRIGREVVPASSRPATSLSMSQADGYIEIPATESAVDRGTIVEVKPF